VYEKIEEIPDRIRANVIGRGDTCASVDSHPDFPTPEEYKIELENLEIQQTHPGLQESLYPSADEHPVDNGGQEESHLSPEEVLAGRTIEAAYRRLMTRKKESLKGIDAIRARLWTLLRDQASSMEWPGNDRTYKLMMQGPLVHVLLCLDAIKMFADRANKATKKQLRLRDDHTRSEELMERVAWSR
jgi:hypothetical protein